MRPQDVHLTGNQFGNEGGIAMSLALKENTALTELTMRGEEEDKNKQTKKCNHEQQMVKLELKEQKQ